MVVRRWVAALLALPLLVSCTDGEASPDPDKPTPSVSPTESKTPTGPVEPVMPEGAKKPTAAGAIAFVKHYWTTVHYAQSTGDLSGLGKLSSKSCDLCRAGLEGLSKIHDEGGRLKGPASRVTSPQAFLSNHGPAGKKFLAARVRHTLVAPRVVEFYGKGDPRNRTFKGGKDEDYFLLVWKDDDAGWLITDWSIS